MGADITAAVVSWLVLIIAFAVTVQSAVGFGFSLIAAPLLIGLVGVDVAVPLLSVLGFTQQSILSVLYRKALNWRAVVPLVLGSTLLIPVGVLLVDYLPERVVLVGLGLIVISYALYELAQFQLPPLASPRWAYLFGGVSGVLSGAYNIPGPPVILYANCRRWHPDEFKSNLQSFFLINSIFLVLSRALNRQLTGEVWLLCLAALPAIALGSLIGVKLSKRLNPDLFRKMVLILLIAVGIRLMV